MKSYKFRQLYERELFSCTPLSKIYIRKYQIPENN